MKNLRIVNYKYVDGIKEVYPAHPLVSNMLFTENEEAILANAMAVVADKNKVSSHEVKYAFYATLRLLKNKWDQI